MRRLFLCCSSLALLFSSYLSASELNVVTTVKPLNLIVQELTDGIAQTEYLLPPGTSPHDYALRPSDVKKLRDADLVVWGGPELEMFLTKILENKKNSLAITQQHAIDFRHYEHGAEIHHGDHTHSHDGVDPHFWLGPKQSVQVAQVITEALIQLDPLNKNRYKDNLSQFASNVEKAVDELNAELKPLADRGYYVFHDAYGYFEEQFKLNNLGHFTVDPDRRPGAKTLVTIRRSLQNKQAQCVFSEPQFSPSVVKSVVSGTHVNVGTLDPMATEIAEGKGGYIRFLHELGQSYIKCLKQ